MAVGRISGPLLKSNLIRNGIDLAFETDLLYLDVNNQRIGIKTTTPQYELDVNGTTRTTDLSVTNIANLGDITVQGNTISTTEPYLNLATLDTVVGLNKIRIDSIDIEGNAITTNSSNANLELRPNGTGTVNVHSDMNVDGNIHATGNISADGDIVIGSVDQTSPNDDTVQFNAEIASDIIPDADRTYNLGSDPATGGKEWNDVWVNNLVASSINSQDLTLDGIDMTLRHGNMWYVAENGDDAQHGDHVLDPFASIKHALSVATAGDVVHVSPGVYTEEFPLTVPQGVTIRGEGLRGVTVQPTTATRYNDAILLNGETTVEDLTVTGFYKSASTEATLSYVLDNPNAYGTSAGDYFGARMSIDGNYAIFGAYNEDDAGGVTSGKVYIFDVTTGSLLRTLDNPNPYSASLGDYFGYDVEISGNYAIVSAPFEDDAGGNNSGKAYIYNVTTGSLVHTLDNPNPVGTSASDNFGYSAGISGNYAIVGAPDEDDASQDSGKAYIYNVTTGNLLHTLDNPTAYGTGYKDNFGSEVAISGNYAIVGVDEEDDASGTRSGKAYIFDVTTGNLLHTLDNPNPYGTSDSDWFSSSVSISGNYAIFGAYGEDDAGGNNSGKAYIYNVTTGNLLHTLDNPNPVGTSADDLFGIRVAITGNYAVVSAYREDETLNDDRSGKAYIYNVNTGALLYQLDNPNAYDTIDNDQFGIGVEISGNRVIVGAFFEDDAGGSASGKAYIYNLTETDVAGYAFRFADGASITSRSPYIRNVTVITEGPSVALGTNSADDPRGYNDHAAGKGALVDGSALDNSSNEAGMLFHGATFITPGVDAITATNGARIEWLNSFTYFANRSIYAYDSAAGIHGQGKTRIRLSGVSGTFAAGDTVTFTSTDASTVINLSVESVENVANDVNAKTLVVGGKNIDLLGFDTTPASITNGTATATTIDDVDIRDFGAEIRSIASASVYGDYGIVGDGESVLVYAIGHNLAYIGNGKEVTNDATTVIQANEIVEVNGARIRYNSVDHKGDFRVGDLFYVNQDTGNVTFAVSDFTINTDNGVTFVTGGDTTLIDGTKVETGDWRISGNTVETLTQDANFAAGSGEINLNSNVNVNGSLDVTGNVTIGGNITIGDEETDTIQIIAGIDSDITPKVDSTYSLGTATKQWSNLFVNQVNVDNIVIRDNFIETTLSNSDLELRANGTGNIYIPSNDVVLDQDLRVYGTTTLADTVLNGDITQVGNTTQTGNIDLTGEFDLTGNVTITDAAQFENVNIDDNVIKTTISNSDLELRATQYGDIVIPSNDVTISQDLYVTGAISTGDLYTAGTITANRFSTGDIVIDDNYVTTTLSNSNLELRANGTGEILVPSNDVTLEQNLTVNGSTYLKDTNIVGTVTHTGNVTQVGNINLTGNLDVTGEVNISATVIQFEQIQLSGNAITTTESNADLELRANGTGEIYIPTNDVEITNNLTVNGTISVGNITSTNAITANTFSTGDILIDDNYITTTASNSDLELRTAGTGAVIIDTFNINNDTITTSGDFNITPGSNLVNINATGALTLPAGDTSQRPTGVAGQVRFNSDLARFEGYNGTNWVNLKGVEDLDGNTKVTAELTEGANDNTIRFYINGSQTVDINNTRLAAPRVDVDDIRIDGNVITTTNGNKNLNLTANGTGKVKFDNLAFKGSTITNTVANSVTEFNSTGNGYVKFSGTYGIVLPVGASGTRPPIEYSEIGQMRYNTTDERVEVWDGSSWVSVAGSASGITRNDAEEIALATVLVLG